MFGCGGLTLTSNQAVTRCTLAPCSQQSGRENRMHKGKKDLVEHDKDSLTSERKRQEKQPKASGAKAINHHLPPAD